MTVAEILSGLVRPACTLLLTSVLCYGFIVDKIPQEQFIPIVVMVIGFWFGTRSAEKAEDNEARALRRLRDIEQDARAR